MNCINLRDIVLRNVSSFDLSEAADVEVRLNDPEAVLNLSCLELLCRVL